MALTPEQRLILKAAIAADEVLNALPLTNAAADVIVAAYNSAAVPDYYVWKPETGAQEIFNAIDWAKMTPAGAVGTDVAWSNRSLACQGKQFNLQTILTGRLFINSDKANIRAGIQDALTALPSKADGTTQGAGWAAVEAIMKRLATRAEKLFATGNGQVGTPSLMAFAGSITQDDVTTAREMT
jgi:hypothetical protein